MAAVAHGAEGRVHFTIALDAAEDKSPAAELSDSFDELARLKRLLERHTACHMAGIDGRGRRIDDGQLRIMLATLGFLPAIDIARQVYVDGERIGETPKLDQRVRARNDFVTFVPQQIDHEIAHKQRHLLELAFTKPSASWAWSTATIL